LQAFLLNFHHLIYQTNHRGHGPLLQYPGNLQERLVTENTAADLFVLEKRSYTNRETCDWPLFTLAL